MDYPPEIRKVIYTTNVIESVNMGMKNLSKNRGSFPSDEALIKQFYLALRNIRQKCTIPIRDWKTALTRFTDSVRRPYLRQPSQALLHKNSDTSLIAKPKL